MKAALPQNRRLGRGPEFRDPPRSGGLRLSALLPLVVVIFLATLHPAKAGLPPGWSSTNIGVAVSGDSASTNNGAWTISGSGTNIGGTGDQFNFEYQVQNANFDVTVCLASMSLSDLWSQ